MNKPFQKKKEKKIEELGIEDPMVIKLRACTVDEETKKLITPAL